VKEADLLGTSDAADLAQHCFAVLDQPEHARRHRIETVMMIDAGGQQRMFLIVFDRLLPSAFPKPKRRNP